MGLGDGEMVRDKGKDSGYWCSPAHGELAGYWAEACLWISIIPHPDSRKLPGTPSKATCSEFTETVSTTHKPAAPPPRPPLPPVRRPVGGTSPWECVSVTLTLSCWRKAPPSFLANNFGSTSNKHLNHMLRACVFLHFAVGGVSAAPPPGTA